MIHEQPPARAEAAVKTGRFGPECGACGGRLAHREQWRCPYVKCRKWFRDASDPELVSPKRRTRDAA